MEKKKIDRREFLKTLGLGAAATTAALYGCAPKGGSAASAPAGEVPTDGMTYRTSPSSGDRVSLLGYGCMRWPQLPTPAADGNPIDQETVNALVDYAIAHGVNYFDTAPVYMQGFSERSTGIALKRHPRESYFIATKMSNFSNFSRSMPSSSPCALTHSSAIVADSFITSPRLPVIVRPPLPGVRMDSI